MQHNSNKPVSGYLVQIIPLLLILLILACATKKEPENFGMEKYVSESRELYDTIVRLDSLLFAAYNNCDLNQFAALIDEDIEFYHDKGGLSTSKDEIVEAIKNNICNKVQRELVPGSIEVYPIHDYGAIEMGQHRFHNLVEHSTSRPGKFVHTWHYKDGQWKLSRVISLH